MQAVKEDIEKLFKQYSNAVITGIEKIPQSGSDRVYFRISCPPGSYIATYSKNIKENITFINFSRHFKNCGCPVPEIYAVNEEQTIYIQEDFGDTALLNELEQKGHGENVYVLFQKSLRALAYLQINGEKGFNYDWCITSREFGKQAIMEAPDLALSIRPGVLAPEGLVIVIVPSEDRVGRLFPLCAGLQWDEPSLAGRMGWPPADYAKSLVACLRRNLAFGVSPDLLVDEIAAVGSFGQFTPTFVGSYGDDTVPRLGSDTNLLRVQGPMAAMTDTNRALCAAMSDSSDVLGLSLDGSGDPIEFVACRRFTGGQALASMFDGLWSERGWASRAVQLIVAPAAGEDVINADDDATQPRLRRIDTSTPDPDSSVTP